MKNKTAGRSEDYEEMCKHSELVDNVCIRCEKDMRGIIKMKPAHMPTLWKIENEEFILDCEWANIEEVRKLEKNNEPMLRVYRNAPESLKIQIRTYDGIGEWHKGVKRNMIATIPVSFTNAKALIAYLQESIAKAEGR
jgi:hypothetical protein